MTDELEQPTQSGSPPAPTDGGGPAPSGPDGSLLVILDRLTALLERSDLTEIEVEAGGTGLILRKAVAVAAAAPSGGTVPGSASASTGIDVGLSTAVEAPPGRPSVKAPLTGIFYTAPGPGSAAYVQVGGEVAVGQVIGLIEAMKLFNEIKSDLAGRVVKVVAETGSLVKAKQPLIEVEPL